MAFHVSNFSTFSNNSNLDSDTSVLGAAYLTVGLSVISTNGVVVLVIVKTRDLHLPTLWLIAIMAVNDFFTGCLVLVFHAPSALAGRYFYATSIMRVSLYLRLFLTGQTCANIAMVILDRYIAVRWPLLYPKIVTTKRIFLSVLCTVAVGIGRFGFLRLSSEEVVFDFTLALVTPTQIIHSEGRLLRIFGVVSVPVISFTIIVFSFCGIFRNIRPHNRVASLSGVSDNTTKFPLMAATSVGVFCLAYIPFIISVVLFMTDSQGYFVMILIRTAVLAVYSVSFWNVFIYTATYQPFRDALMRLFCYSNHRRRRQIEVECAFNTKAVGKTSYTLRQY